jgi:hypothetical protein
VGWRTAVGGDRGKQEDRPTRSDCADDRLLKIRRVVARNLKGGRGMMIVVVLVMMIVVIIIAPLVSFLFVIFVFGIHGVVIELIGDAVGFAGITERLVGTIAFLERRSHR